MKVTSIGDDLFLLEPETEQDADFLSALDLSRFAKVVRHERQLDIDDKFSVDSAVVSTKFDSANHLPQTLLKVQSLMFAQPHDQGHVGADAVDPHAQERALAIIKKLNVVLDALGAVVSKDDVHLDKSPTASQQAAGKLLRIRDLENLTGLRKSSIYTYMKGGLMDFPTPIKIGRSAVAWKEEDVIEWMNSREKSKTHEPQPQKVAA